MSVEHQSGLPSVQPLCLLRKEFFKKGPILYGKEAQICNALEILSCDDLCGNLGGPFVVLWEARGGPLEDPGRPSEDPLRTLGRPLGGTAEDNLATDIRTANVCVHVPRV